MPNSLLEAAGLTLLIIAALPTLILGIAAGWRFCVSFVREVRRIQLLADSCPILPSVRYRATADGRIEVLFEGDEFPAADCSAGERAAVLEQDRPVLVVNNSEPRRYGVLRHESNVIDLCGPRHSQKDNGGHHAH